MFTGKIALNKVKEESDFEVAKALTMIHWLKGFTFFVCGKLVPGGSKPLSTKVTLLPEMLSKQQRLWCRFIPFTVLYM